MPRGVTVIFVPSTVYENFTSVTDGTNSKNSLEREWVRQSLLSTWSHFSARHIKSIHHNHSVRRFEQQRKHRETEIKSMENRKGS